MGHFRFQNLDIWKQSIHLADQIFDICDELEKRHLYRFAEQLRGAILSISNNIAEGSGSSSKKEFSHFLNMARRSCFEVANMIILFHMRNLLDSDLRTQFLENCDHLSRRITRFQNSIKASL